MVDKMDVLRFDTDRLCILDKKLSKNNIKAVTINYYRNGFNINSVKWKRVKRFGKVGYLYDIVLRKFNSSGRPETIVNLNSSKHDFSAKPFTFKDLIEQIKNPLLFQTANHWFGVANAINGLDNRPEVDIGTHEYCKRIII